MSNEIENTGGLVVTKSRKPKVERSKAQKTADMLTVMEMTLKGYQQHEIAKRLGIARSTVSYDLQKAYKMYLGKITSKVDEIKKRELAKLDLIESELWELYEASKKTAVRTTTKTVGKGGKDGKTIEASQVEVTQTEEARIGDASILTQIVGVIDKRAKLLGLEKIQVEHSGTITTIEAKISAMSDQELEAEINRLSLPPPFLLQDTE